MTMPDERMRSIRWCREVLDEIAHDSLVPTRIQACAAKLHSAYPCVPEIVNRIAVGAADSLPAEWWDTMGQALTLLSETRSGGFGSPDTQRGILFTLRHYPDHGLLEFLARTDSLDGWLAPEHDV